MNETDCVDANNNTYNRNIHQTGGIDLDRQSLLSIRQMDSMSRVNSLGDNLVQSYYVLLNIISVFDNVSGFCVKCHVT